MTQSDYRTLKELRNALQKDGVKIVDETLIKDGIVFTLDSHWTMDEDYRPQEIVTAIHADDGGYDIVNL